MTDHPDHPDDTGTPLEPFPVATTVSPFPLLEGEPAEPYLDAVPVDPPGDWIETADPHDLPTAPDPVPPANPLIALGQFAFPPGSPPDDEGVAARDRRWASRTIVIAGVFLLIFNAVSIQNWSRQQAPGWVTTTVRRVADVWVEQISQLGADQPRQAVRDGYEAGRDADWPEAGS